MARTNVYFRVVKSKERRGNEVGYGDELCFNCPMVSILREFGKTWNFILMIPGEKICQVPVSAS